MTFTDNDLERLKEWAQTVCRIPYEDDPDVEFSCTAQEFLALLSRLEAHELLNGWLEHSRCCIRESWCAGRPTENGYEAQFGDKWYQQKPVDETPKCDCGLDDAYEVWRKVARE